MPKPERTPTTGDKVRATVNFMSGRTGVIVSGPSERNWFRIKLDPLPERTVPTEEFAHLFAAEFEVVQEAGKKVDKCE